MAKKLAKTLLVLAIILLGSLPIVINALSCRSSANTPTGPATTIATVDGKPIAANIYEMYLKNGIEALSLNPSTDEGRRQLELLKDGVISDLIDRALVDAEARRRNLNVPDEAVAKARERTIAQMGGEQQYLAYLTEHGLSDEEFRQSLAQQLHGELLSNELVKNIAVSEDEIRDFYNQRRHEQSLLALFKEPERIEARHILIAARRSRIAAEIESEGKLSAVETERRVADEIKRRRKLAESILVMLRRGADFAALARRYSEDPGTREKGGDLGAFPRNTHTARFDDAAFALKAGQLSNVVETDFGFHIIKVTRQLPERDRTLGETRAQIERHLFARKRAQHLNAWLERRRREADIRVDPLFARRPPRDE